MKILQISDLAPPHIGGVEKVVWRYSRYLAEKGFDVTLLTSLLPGTVKEEKVDNVKIVRVPKPLLSFPFYFDSDFDIVHTHSYLSFFSIALEKKFRKKVFLKHIHIFYGELAQDFMGWNLFNMGNTLERLSVLADCTAYIVPSEFSKMELIELGAKRKIHVIPHGMEFDNFPDKMEARKMLGFPQDKKIVGFVGRLVKGKGALDIINVWSEIVERNRNALLLIVGPNPDIRVSGIKGIMDDMMAKTKRLGIEDSVIFSGEVGDDLLPYYLSSMDIFVAPTYKESFGLSILNAMSAGLPVIAYSNSSVRELIDNDSGILVNTGDRIALRDSIINLLEDERLAESLGKNASTRAKKFSWEKSINDLINVYQSYL